jgi:hypothetical protein
LYECKNKGLTEFAFRKWLILKDAFSIVCTNWETYRKKEKRQQNYRTPKMSLPTTAALCNGEKKLEKRKAAKGRRSLTGFFPEEIVHNRKLRIK